MKKTKRTTQQLAQPAPYPKVYETFNPPESWQIHVQHEPSCFNDIVRVRRYRILIEEIEEPLDVIHQRLRDLWETSGNHHHYHPLKRAAAVGLSLDEGFGRRAREAT